MAIPPVDADAVRRALREFDATLRNSPEWSSWESNKAQTYVLVEGERRYPPKKIVSMATGIAVSSFSGGLETNGYLEQRGFKVERLRNPQLSDLLSLILERYGTARKTESFGGYHEMREIFEQARKRLSSAAPVSSRSHLHVHASYGKGNWATIPWISVLDDRETTTTQDGTYVVYLFREDGKGCYVKLAQGVTKMERELGAQAGVELSKRADVLRKQVGFLEKDGFDLTGVTDLATEHRQARLYEASTIASKFYAAEAVPSEEALLSDLDVLLNAYEQIVEQRPQDASPSIDSRAIALVGTWREVREEVSAVEAAIALRGAWASPWSFLIKQDAKGRLHTPFYLYVNAGGGEFPVRLRVDDYQSSASSDGIVSPWQEITDENLRGVTRSGVRHSEVWRTWLRIGAVEHLKPPVRVRELDTVLGLSTPENVLNQNSFGYVYQPDDNAGGETTYASAPLVARESPPPRVTHDLPWLIATTGLPEVQLLEMVNALKGHSPQIILSGPPGTGKTWIAKNLARYITGGHDERVSFVQFHPAYSYESFVEGLRPVGRQGGVTFEQTPGVVVGLVQAMRARGHLGDDAIPYVVIIDEVNRANLPRVLGELMFLMEYRNAPIQMQYSSSFALPSNLYFICTMNSADRSVRSIDIALRRRFEFFQVTPSLDVLRSYLAAGEIEAEEVVSGLRSLNEKLTSQLDKHHTLGHTFFMRNGLSWADVKRVWDRKIEPLLDEYFFDQPDLAAEFQLQDFWPNAVDG